MKKHGMRKIVVKNQTFLWKVEHLHLQEYVHSKCVERVTIFKEGNKQSPLRLWFREEDNLLINKDLTIEKWQVGYPSKGEIWHYKRDIIPNRTVQSINLNRPAVIAALITHFLKDRWKPMVKKPCEITNALTYLETLDLPSGDV